MPAATPEAPTAAEAEAAAAEEVEVAGRLILWAQMKRGRMPMRVTLMRLST